MNIHVPQKPKEIFFFLGGGVCPRTESIEKVSVKFKQILITRLHFNDTRIKILKSGGC